VSRKALISALLAGIAGIVLLAVGVVYLTVACESLPGILGPHPGDTSPRTPLGVIGVVLGAAALGLAWFAIRRKPPKAPLRS
jgi:divalent metal cation (Fe/Co/Zn/Cd) transporter